MNIPGIESARDIVDLTLGLAIGLSIALCMIALWRHRKHWR